MYGYQDLRSDTIKLAKKIMRRENLQIEEAVEEAMHQTLCDGEALGAFLNHFGAFDRFISSIITSYDGNSFIDEVAYMIDIQINDIDVY